MTNGVSCTLIQSIGLRLISLQRSMFEGTGIKFRFNVDFFLFAVMILGAPVYQSFSRWSVGSLVLSEAVLFRKSNYIFERK